MSVSCVSEGWTPPLPQVLGAGPVVYLVRPDGYIGFRGKGDDESLWAYALSVGLM